jgi:predicted RNA-binding protein YlqC (UPF0109 family)
MGATAEVVLRAMLEVVVATLVDDVDSINISATTTAAGDTVLFEVDVAKEDVGKLIGRSGKTAGALRHILGAASAKLKVRTILSIPDKKDQ